jgi:hypothetical protein
MAPTAAEASCPGLFADPFRFHRSIDSAWFASLPADGWPTGPGTGGSAYHILRRLVLMPDTFLVL